MKKTVTIELNKKTARGLQLIAKASGESIQGVAAYFVSAAAHAAHSRREVQHQVENMQATY